MYRKMRLTNNTAGILLCGLLLTSGPAFAVEQTGPTGKGDVATQTPSASGRPSAILDDAQCQNIWKEAASSAETLSAEAATPYVANFRRVDADNDGKISQAEFTEGCKLGWVQAAAGSEKLNMPAEPEGMKDAKSDQMKNSAN